MTTERSGMSLTDRDMALAAIPSVYWDRVRELFTEIEKRRDHLSRDAVVSDEDVADAQLVHGDAFSNGFSQDESWRLALQYFAAGHAAIPAGYVLVPVEPTEAMLEAAERREDDEPLSSWGKSVRASHCDIYKAMLAQRDGG